MDLGPERGRSLPRPHRSVAKAGLTPGSPRHQQLLGREERLVVPGSEAGPKEPISRREIRS